MGSLPQVVEDHLGFLQVFSDGSVFRVKEDDLPFRMKIQDDGSTVWKDCLFDKKHTLRLRLYKPSSISGGSSAKLPILFFFHGGGFIFGSRTWPNSHNTCLRLSAGLQALVVAPDYRLAPEHRLPAAVDDAFSAAKWLQAQALAENPDAWLGNGVDFDRVFVVGDSSGGTLTHHLAVKLGGGSPELAPVRVRGYVLLAPFFGGSVRTKSEMEASEPYLKLEFLDRFWRLSLPIGATFDHPLANPFGPTSPSLEPVTLDPILVMVGGSEIMKDRVEDYVRRMEVLGKKINYAVFPGEPHGFFTDNPFSEKGEETLQEIKDFMSKNSN